MSSEQHTVGGLFGGETHINRHIHEAKLSLGQPTVLPHSRISSNQRLLLNSISSCFRDIGL